jgi:hypothetical protein
LDAPEGTASDESFRRRYLEHVSVTLDMLELFGARVERYRPRTTLSVAYISLSVSMDAADYAEHTTAARRRGTPLQPLAGAPVEATWDPELTPAMSALGLAVQEESALELIVADLL